MRILGTGREIVRSERDLGFLITMPSVLVIWYNKQEVVRGKIVMLRASYMVPKIVYHSIVKIFSVYWVLVLTSRSLGYWVLVSHLTLKILTTGRFHVRFLPETKVPHGSPYE